jgi:acetyl-CoA carboxylase biotin carboxyl carrier protein
MGVWSEEEIEKLAAIAERCGLEEVEVEQRGVRMRIRRQGSGALPRPVPVAADSPVPQPVGGKLLTIHAPMVGTFYRSAAPDRPAFVEIGSTVSPTAAVCILEAMKVMNEIPAEISGTVVEVLARDGQAVEFGQPLFRVRAEG